MPNATALPVEHPGTFIVEELEERGWTQVDLAYVLGISAQQLNPILSGKQSITPDMATALSEAFDVPPAFFTNLQAAYDLYKAKRPDPGVRTRATWVSQFPVREMIKRGWIEDTEPSLLDLQMLRFFGKNRIEEVPFVGKGTIISHAAKRSGYDEMTAVQYVWLHRVKKIAEAMDAPRYSEDCLRSSLPKIRAHMQDKDDLIQIPQILRNCGVRFVLVEALPRSKIDGVCVWVGDNGDQPAIGISTRLDRLDNICFVIRHEIEHVLWQHGKAETFTPVDEFNGEGNEGEQDEEEAIANEAAGEFLIPRQYLESFIARKSPFISERDVLAFAARMEIHPAIVVGQIQNRTKRYGWLRKYQRSIRDYLMDWEFKDGWGYTPPTGL